MSNKNIKSKFEIDTHQNEDLLNGKSIHQFYRGNIEDLGDYFLVKKS